MNGRVTLRASAKQPVPGSQGGLALPAGQVIDVAVLLRTPPEAPTLKETAHKVAAAVMEEAHANAKRKGEPHAKGKDEAQGKGKGKGKASPKHWTHDRYK